MSRRLRSSARLGAAILGVLVGILAVSHAYQAFEIETPIGMVAFWVLVALLQIGVSVGFAVAPSRKVDSSFLFIFAIASIEDVGRYILVPFNSLLVTPAAFFAAVAALLVERRKVKPSAPE